MARSLRHLEPTTLRRQKSFSCVILSEGREKLSGDRYHTACTACEFIDFSGSNSNHGEKISP
jgi:hypothetical protein